MSRTAPLYALLALLAILPTAPVSGSPYRVSFAGPQATEEGLLVAGGIGVGHVVTSAGGRPCWATDRRSGRYLIAVNLPDSLARPQPAPLRVTVTYLDFGKGQWALVYAGLSEGQTFRRHSPVIQKQDTAAWRQAEFYLPDFTGRWLAVDSFGAMVDEDDEFLTDLTVRLGGPALLTPAVLAAGEKHFLEALYWSPDSPRENQGIELRASAGKIQELALAGPAPAEIEYTAPATPGLVTLEARVDGLRSSQSVLSWPGRLPLQIESTLVDPAHTLDAWMYWPVAAEVTLASGGDPQQSGGASLAFAFTGPCRPGYVDLTRRTFLRGAPLDLNLDVRGDSGGARLQAILEDAGGQRFCYDLGPVAAEDWTALRGSLRGPARYWGGAGDGLPRYPLYFLSLRLVQGPEGTSPSGKLFLRDVFVRSMAPTP